MVKMVMATEVQNIMRNFIHSSGWLVSGDILHFDFSGATKAYDDEGNVTISNWNGFTTIQAIILEQKWIEASNETQGEEQTGTNVFFVKDNAVGTIDQRDAIGWNGEIYYIDEITNISLGTTFIGIKITTGKQYVVE